MIAFYYTFFYNFHHKSCFFQFFGREENNLLGYQKQLLDCSKNINQSNIVIVSNYFYRIKRHDFDQRKKYKELKYYFNKTKKILIMLSSEDITINFDSCDLKSLKNINGIIGLNTEQSLYKYFKKPSCSYLFYSKYVEHHKTLFKYFIKRKFYLMTAISNKQYMVNSNRIKYLDLLIKNFGSEKVANYGHVYRNQNIPNNRWTSKLPNCSFFGFAMENSISEYRITEKLFFMYDNDVIPIYRGHINNSNILKKYGINLNSFIDASNYTEIQLYQLLKFYIENPVEMYKIYIQPFIKNKIFFENELKKRFNRCLNLFL